MFLSAFLLAGKAVVWKLPPFSPGSLSHEHPRFVSRAAGRAGSKHAKPDFSSGISGSIPVATNLPKELVERALRRAFEIGPQMVLSPLPFLRS